MEWKTLTLRISIELAHKLDLIAKANETTVSEEVRQAIKEYIDFKRQDPDFQHRLNERIKADKKILNRLK